MTKGHLKPRLKLPLNTLMIACFGDVVYTVLPILALAVLRVTLNKGFSNFLLLPEWSFASIVFFGLSIRQGLELKIKYQKDFSERLFLVPLVVVPLLIASVLSLSLVELNQETKNMNEHFLTVLQMALFLVGLVTILSVNYFKGIEIEGG
jgi:hypothetical protein